MIKIKHQNINLGAVLATQLMMLRFLVLKASDRRHSHHINGH
ncbi:hypothetical protein [Echinicola shivajiensis]|nr:hypothetical protein [Echinicola shivajiensis]